MIGYPTTFTTSVQRFNHFGPSYSINNDTEYLQSFIVALRMIQKSICKLCGRVVHKADDCIIRCPEYLPSILRININQFNALHGKEQN